MIRSSDVIVLGYHGTIEPSAVDIVKQRNFTRSQNPFDWLGDGAYFFQDAPLRAWLWAKRAAKEKGSEPAVVVAEIYLGECLDLLDIRWVHIARAYHQVMVKSGRRPSPQAPPILRTKPREDVLIEEMEPTYKEKGVGYNRLDREVFNFTIDGLINDHSPSILIDSVRAAFQEGHPLYERSFIWDRSHIQVVVRDIRMCIMGTRRLDKDLLEALRNDANKNVVGI